MWEYYIRTITPLPTGYMKRMHQQWVEKGMKKLDS